MLVHMHSSVTEDEDIRMSGRISVRVAGEADVSSPVQLVGCTDQQAVVR